MNKLIELRRAKMLALSLLLIAAATFVVTLFLPPNFWVSGVKAIAEAAMVGALADWFAVVALFRRVPIPIISRHTAIIPRNKDRIGENLRSVRAGKISRYPIAGGIDSTSRTGVVDWQLV